MSVGRLSHSQYFSRPFSVRKSNGQPFEFETNRSTVCTQPRETADVLITSGLVHEQREQRRLSQSHLALHQANFKLHKDSYNMEIPIPRSMLKRKHSMDNPLVSSPKRVRTLSEPHFIPQRYPLDRQPTSWKDSYENEASEGRPHLSHSNALLLGVHQTPKAFSHGLNGWSHSSQPNPLPAVKGDIAEPELIYQMPAQSNALLVTGCRYPSEDSPSSSDLQQPEKSAMAVSSIETEPSSQSPLNERGQMFPWSRGPSFSPITTKSSSPDPHIYDTDRPSSNYHNPKDLHGSLGGHEYGLDPSHVMQAIQEAPGRPHFLSDIPDLSQSTEQILNDVASLHLTKTTELTRDNDSTDIYPSAEAPVLNTSSLSNETHEDPKSKMESYSTDKNSSLVRLRFANKSALINAIESFQAPANFDAEVAADKRSSKRSTMDYPNPTATIEAVQAHENMDDHQFVDQVKTVLKAQSKWKTANVARRSARRIRQLLEIAQPPSSSEALFISGEEASKQLERGNLFDGPIITKGQQPLPLQTTAQFLSEYYDDAAVVWIQDPAIKLERNVPHAREITIGQLKQRFTQPLVKSRIPWNCLEMATHVEDGLRPAFLNNEDCRLLTKLKIPGSADSASRRGYDPGWKEVEKWALLAQGGALTEPHQDSHGYGTYITLNQGAMGFGWLSNPTPEERAAWRDKPATFVGGRWRYIILRPGQTVYFPSGTVHFVFRLAAVGDTLAFGGHVLRCSQIVRWVETILQEQWGPDVTNEELSVSAPAYLARVEKFVRQALKNGDVERWGGAEAIERFLQLKKEFLEQDRKRHGAE